MVFCRDQERTVTIFSEAPGFLAALTAAGGVALAGPLANIKRAQTTQRKAAGRLWLVAASAVLLLLVGGYVGLRSAAGVAARALPVSVDRKLGDAAYAALPKQGPLVTDPVVVNAVQDIVSRLAVLAPPTFTFRVAVVDSEIKNAFCLPGGQIVVFTGLLALAESPSEVAGVLAHEMAHAVLRHGIERVAQTMGVVVAFQLLIGDVAGLAALGAQLAQEGLLTSYSRDQESAADLHGLPWTNGAGFDAQALGTILLRLDKGTALVPSWLGSHPEPRQRQAAIASLSRTLTRRAPVVLPFNWGEVRAHLPRPAGVDSKTEVNQDAGVPDAGEGIQ